MTLSVAQNPKIKVRHAWSMEIADRLESYLRDTRRRRVTRTEVEEIAWQLAAEAGKSQATGTQAINTAEWSGFLTATDDHDKEGRTVPLAYLVDHQFREEHEPCSISMFTSTELWAELERQTDPEETPHD